MFIGGKLVQLISVRKSISHPVPHSRQRLAVADPSPQSIYCDVQFTNICKTAYPKVVNEILDYNQLPLRRTCSGPAPTVRLKEVSTLEGDEVND